MESMNYPKFEQGEKVVINKSLDTDEFKVNVTQNMRDKRCKIGTIVETSQFSRYRIKFDENDTFYMSWWFGADHISKLQKLKDHVGCFVMYSSGKAMILTEEMAEEYDNDGIHKNIKSLQIIKIQINKEWKDIKEL